MVSGKEGEGSMGRVGRMVGMGRGACVENGETSGKGGRRGDRTGQRNEKVSWIDVWRRA